MGGPLGSERTRLIVVVLVSVAAVIAVVTLAPGDRDVDDVDTARGATSDPAPASTVIETTTTLATTTSTTDPLGSGATITMAFAGDSYAEGVLRQRLDERPQDFVGPYADLFRSVDLTVLNLETAITEGGDRLDKSFTFRAPPRILDALEAGGVDVVSLANNHGMDYGLRGLQDSVSAKRARADGMVIGIGLDEDEAYAPHLTEIDGQRIAVIGATQVLDDSLIESWTAGPDKPGLASAKRVDRLVAEVERVRPDVDTLAVTVHWGVETETCPTQVQKDLARRLVDAGADIVVGGHQHRVAGGGRLDGALIHYGLGNFLFKENSAAGAKTGVLVVDVTGRRIDGYRWEPGRIANSLPAPLAGAERDAALAEWNGLRGCTDLEP